MATASETIKPDAPVPEFRLRATDGRTYTLDDVAGEKGTIIVFICNHSKLTRCELTFPNPMHELDASDCDRRITKSLEAEHRAQTELDGSVILLN